ncbi:nucleoside monophosphate kinase [Candidatus Woesearchaeota archaeon]|nr:nucleoside monophosphate kinase [Candidatus Woesearchaeota archaeon]
MIITIAGDPGSGKSTVAELVASKLRLKHVSVGDLLRELAGRRGVSILEISRLAEKDRSVDEYLDSRQRQLAKEDGLVVDSRLGWHFIPRSFKVFLKVSPEEAGKRIFSARRKTERENTTLAATIENTKQRKQSERVRYKRYYNLNPFDMSHYDLVIDTTKMQPEGVAGKIISDRR